MLPYLGNLGQCGKMVREIEMDDPTIGKLVKKNEMGVPKVEKVGIVGKLVKRIETGGSANKKTDEEG